MLEFFQYQFMQRALIAAVLVSIACGVVGSYVVIKRIVSLSGAISHAAFGGVGLGYFLGVNPVLAAIPFSIISAMAIGGIKQITNISEDTGIGILWSVGMAIGVIFINLTPGYAPDLFSYLFGSILTVNNTDLYIMLTLDIIIIAIVYLFRREFLAISFDEEFSKGNRTTGVTYIYASLSISGIKCSCTNKSGRSNSSYCFIYYSCSHK